MTETWTHEIVLPCPVCGKPWEFEVETWPTGAVTRFFDAKHAYTGRVVGYPERGECVCQLTPNLTEDEEEIAMNKLWVQARELAKVEREKGEWS